MTELELLMLIYQGMQAVVGLLAFILGVQIAFFVHLKGLF